MLPGLMRLILITGIMYKREETEIQISLRLRGLGFTVRYLSKFRR